MDVLFTILVIYLWLGVPFQFERQIGEMGIPHWLVMGWLCCGGFLLFLIAILISQ